MHLKLYKRFAIIQKSDWFQVVWWLLGEPKRCWMDSMCWSGCWTMTLLLLLSLFLGTCVCLCVCLCPAFACGALWVNCGVTYLLEQPSTVFGKWGPGTFWCVPSSLFMRCQFTGSQLDPGFTRWFLMAKNITGHQTPRRWKEQNTCRLSIHACLFLKVFLYPFAACTEARWRFFWKGAQSAASSLGQLNLLVVKVSV